MVDAKTNGSMQTVFTCSALLKDEDSGLSSVLLTYGGRDIRVSTRLRCSSMDEGPCLGRKVASTRVEVLCSLFLKDLSTHFKFTSATC
jgi:hypothetical protein